MWGNEAAVPRNVYSSVLTISNNEAGVLVFDFWGKFLVEC